MLSILYNQNGILPDLLDYFQSLLMTSLYQCEYCIQAVICFNLITWYMYIYILCIIVLCHSLDTIMSTWTPVHHCSDAFDCADINKCYCATTITNAGIHKGAFSLFSPNRQQYLLCNPLSTEKIQRLSPPHAI